MRHLGQGKERRGRAVCSLLREARRCTAPQAGDVPRRNACDRAGEEPHASHRAGTAISGGESTLSRVRRCYAHEDRHPAGGNRRISVKPTEMRASVSSQPFRDLAASLKDGGFTTHSSRLESILNGTWTTSSELIGELGVAVLAIRKECEPLTSSQKALVKECVRQVRRAWPGFGLFGWLR